MGFISQRKIILIHYWGIKVPKMGRQPIFDSSSPRVSFAALDELIHFEGTKMGMQVTAQGAVLEQSIKPFGDSFAPAQPIDEPGVSLDLHP
jgi:hypothetical protein